MKVLHLKCLLYCLSICLSAVHAQPILPYKNPSLAVEERVQDLLNRMTAEEKFRQLFMVAGDLGNNPEQFKAGLFGFQVNTTGATENTAGQILQYAKGNIMLETAKKINEIQEFFITQTRLGIPMIAFDEALHGLVRDQATAFPQSIALAATWDTALMGKTANAIAAECKIRGIRQILSPVVNVATDVRWGRVEETYGEDPVLTAAMGVAFVRAFEEMGIVATPKHFAVNHGEGGRDSYPIDVNERLLEETYLFPFKEVVHKAGARSIMTAYNSLNGRQCSANDWLLNEKLKKEWGFHGFVISDAAAVGGANVLHFTAKDYEKAGKQAIENGLDIIFQVAFDSYPLFAPPFLEEKVNRQKLDSAVARVLRIKFELGLFEHPYIALPADDNSSLFAKHRALAKEAAAKSFVLLKNDHKQILPLSPSYKKIALIGTDAIEARLGGYSGNGNNKINLLEAMKQAVGKNTSVVFAPGCGRENKNWNIVPATYFSHYESGTKKAGLTASYYNNITMSGAPTLSRIDEAINFQWTLFSPNPAINYDFFSVKWKGFLTSPASGKYKIGIDGNDGYRLYLNGKLILDIWEGQSYHTTLTDYDFEKNKAYEITIEYKEASGNAWFRLIWTNDIKDNSAEKIVEALDAAKNSDVIIVAAGIDEGEFQDRSYLHLPGKQETMIQELVATGKPVVVLLFGGSAITMGNWIDKVNAVMQVWYPGEAGGEAIADVLLGSISPSGKLPITFPVTEGQLPLVYNHKPTGRGDDYRDGTGQPLFPFGFGLSYTRFEYSNLQFSQKEISIKGMTTITCKVKNIGKMDGEEVVQLYIRDEIASVVQPIKQLKDFKRVFLKAGEEKEIAFELSGSQLQLLNEKMQWITEPGAFRIMIGSSSKDIRLREKLLVN